jgi:hypothetical protein
MKSEFIINAESNSGFGNNQEISDILILFTHMGLFHVSATFHLCANSIKSLQIGQATFNQSQFIFTSFQFVFQAHTTVVI